MLCPCIPVHCVKKRDVWGEWSEGCDGVVNGLGIDRKAQTNMNRTGLYTAHHFTAGESESLHP